MKIERMILKMLLAAIFLFRVVFNVFGSDALKFKAIQANHRDIDLIINKFNESVKKNMLNKRLESLKFTIPTNDAL